MTKLPESPNQEMAELAMEQWDHAMDSLAGMPSGVRRNVAMQMALEAVFRFLRTGEKIVSVEAP